MAPVPPQPQGTERIAVVPLRNSVLFPMSVVPINVGRPRSVRLVEELVGRESALVGVLTQRDADTVEPGFEDLYEVGTLARLVKVIRLGPNNYSVVLNGIGRFRVDQSLGLEPYMRADIVRLGDENADEATLGELPNRLRDATRRMLALLPNLPKETAGILDNVKDAGALADLIASNLPEDQAEISFRQRVLEAVDVRRRIEIVLGVVERHLDVLRVKGEITAMVQEELSRSQRDLVLRQQMRTIREELGEAGDDDEIDELRERVARAELPPEADKVARKQLSRLSGMQPQGAEFQVTRTYVEWLADLPWNRTTSDRFDVREVRRCLDEDHFGLDRVKKRVVEFSAIRQLRRDKKGPILLFVGPPGVGKTSLGRSIARAMGRRYGRIALGGVRDEAEVRGHRRTYVGALPGRIIQALKKAGTRNPVLVLDEVDKMGVDMRGDPAAALLEVLDPEQNNTFVDHYIDVAFDLSEVMFLATANYFDNIPAALRDRMEVIEVPGYTRSEKRAIAEKFLVPKQLKEHALKPETLAFSREGVETIVDFYTREAGVRGLEREIAAVCRDAAVRLAEGRPVENVDVNREWVETVLGAHKYDPEIAERRLAPGAATGLAVTASGGELLLVEVTRMPGKGEITVTGGLRAVMKEAAATALSFVRSKAELLKLDPEFLKTIDLHVHLPRAASSRDGASAGVPIFVAVASLLLDVPVKPDVAMSGELTLRGSILPVSGIKSTVLAAHRAGMRSLVLPAKNERDMEEVPDEIKSDLQIHFVHRVDEVLALVLAPPEERGPLSDRSIPPADSGEARP
ncbi:MAG: endopeptidase La [Myxococcales bacterium]|nr:endopeptidase La [Myxococcales bacterium]